MIKSILYVVVCVLLYLVIINHSLIFARVNPNNHLLDSFQNEYYFDNGVEIWAEEFRWFK